MSSFTVTEIESMLNELAVILIWKLIRFWIHRTYYAIEVYVSDWSNDDN